MDKFIVVIAILSGVSILWKIFGKDDPATPAEKPANEPTSQEPDPARAPDPIPPSTYPARTGRQERLWQARVQHEALRRD